MKATIRLAGALLLTAAGLASASAEEAAPPPDLAKTISGLAAPYVEAERIVGGVVGVVRGDETLVVPFGRLVAGPEARPDGETVYEIGSVTKVFTGILLAGMARDGTVALDDPIASLLPEDAKVPGPKDAPIRLLHLATHTSGLPRMPANFSPSDRNNPYREYDAKRMLKGLAMATLHARPGTRYAYSNLGVGLLGLALARKAEMSYEALLRKRILAPLKMTSTAIALSDGMRARLAPGHDADGRSAANWDLDAFAGAGGTHRVRDLAEWNRTLGPGFASIRVFRPWACMRRG